jgi:hypothetical protein
MSERFSFEAAKREGLYVILSGKFGAAERQRRISRHRPPARCPQKGERIDGHGAASTREPDSSLSPF